MSEHKIPFRDKMRMMEALTATKSSNDIPIRPMISKLTPTEFKELGFSWTGHCWHKRVGVTDFSYAPDEDSWLFCSRYFYPESIDDVICILRCFVDKKRSNSISNI